MKCATHPLLDKVPDFSHWNEAAQWFHHGRHVLNSLDPLRFSPENSFECVKGSDLIEPQKNPFGHYSSQNWRKFALATFFADWVSYSKPADQVNFDRLLFIMHAFPQGFRTWWIKLPNGELWPVGYTGWYPIFESVFEIFEKIPEQIHDRLVIPNHSSLGQNSFLYLFNYSILPSLKKSNYSRILMKTYVKDVQRIPVRGLACMTVSEDGARIASQFGMSLSAYKNKGKITDRIYIKRFN